MRKLLSIILYFSSITYADDVVFFQTCFHGKSEAQNALQEVSFIKNRNDKIARSNNCLDFYISKKREELYLKYLKIKFQGLYTLKSTSSDADQRQCNIEVIKVKKVKIHSKTASTIQTIHLSKDSNYKNIETKMTLKILHNTSGMINFEHQSINVHCKITRTGYNLKISSNSPDFKIETSRFVNIGSTIELGDFIQKIDEKNSELSISKGIRYQDRLGKKYTSVKLKGLSL